MLDEKQMARLNELARKKKEQGLTEVEIVEQNKLREAYLTVFKKGMRETLENTVVIDPEGKDVTPEKIKAIKAEKVVQ